MRLRSLPFKHPIDILLILVPIAFVLELMHVAAPVVFGVSALAIIPVAAIMGRATEALSERAGPGIGGLLNATFGNAAELIIAIIGLSRGLSGVVKASITGSIIGNSLLVLGLATCLGGLRHPVQKFNRTAASMGSTLMALAAIGMLVPTLLWYSMHDPMARTAEHGALIIERDLSAEIAAILGVVYVLSLVFSLWTHKHLYGGDASQHGMSLESDDPHVSGKHGQRGSTLGSSIAALVGSSVVVAFLAEFLVGALEPTAKAFGLTDLFVGVIVVAIVGNAAEHSSAVLAAWKNHVDLALHIAIGSTLQIALFVTPLLVGISYFIGPSPMDLHFHMFEVVAVALAVASVQLVAQDGESNWMEGVMLLAVYAILGIAFYFLPV